MGLGLGLDIYDVSRPEIDLWESNPVQARVRARVRTIVRARVRVKVRGRVRVGVGNRSRFRVRISYTWLYPQPLTLALAPMLTSCKRAMSPVCTVGCWINASVPAPKRSLMYSVSSGDSKIGRPLFRALRMYVAE